MKNKQKILRLIWVNLNLIYIDRKSQLEKKTIQIDFKLAQIYVYFFSL